MYFFISFYMCEPLCLTYVYFYIFLHVRTFIPYTFYIYTRIYFYNVLHVWTFIFLYVRNFISYMCVFYVKHECTFLPYMCVYFWIFLHSPNLKQSMCIVSCFTYAYFNFLHVGILMPYICVRTFKYCYWFILL